MKKVKKKEISFFLFLPLPFFLYLPTLITYFSSSLFLFFSLFPLFIQPKAIHFNLFLFEKKKFSYLTSDDDLTQAEEYQHETNRSIHFPERPFHYFEKREKFTKFFLSALLKKGSFFDDFFFLFVQEKKNQFSSLQK